MHNCQHGMVDEPILELQYLASSGVVCMKRGIASNLVNFRLTIAYVLKNSQIMKQSCRKIKNVKFHYLVSQPQQQLLYLKLTALRHCLPPCLTPSRTMTRYLWDTNCSLSAPCISFTYLPYPQNQTKKVCQVLQSYSKKF